jgi:hypothetical protein
MQFIQFIKTLLPHMDKSRILEDLDITQGEFEELLPVIQQAAEGIKVDKFNHHENVALSKEFYAQYDNRKRARKANFLSEIVSCIRDLIENTKFIYSELDSLLEDKIVSDGLTNKKAVLIRAAESLSFISRYSNDLLIYVYNNEATAASGAKEHDMRLAPATIRYVKNNFVKYVAALSNYAIPVEVFKKMYVRMPEIRVLAENADSIKGVHDEPDLDPFSSGYLSGFIGNPIYHARIMIAEWQTSRYKEYQEKLKVIQLRVMHLKMLNEKGNDPKLAKEIEYYQSRADKISKSLSDTESDLGIF